MYSTYLLLVLKFTITIRTYGRKFAKIPPKE